jgi:DNA-binding transcriptional MerR regulator
MKLFTELPAETQFLKHSVAARIHGIHTRTLSRWVEAGIVPPPIVVNKRRYHAVDTLVAAGKRRG